MVGRGANSHDLASAVEADDPGWGGAALVVVWVVIIVASLDFGVGWVD